MTDESGQTLPDVHATRCSTARSGPRATTACSPRTCTSTAVAPAGSDAIVASAQARGVPVVSAQQMLTWLDGRNGSSFGEPGLERQHARASRSPPRSGARNLRAMLPMTVAVGAADRDHANGVAGRLHHADDQGHRVRVLPGRLPATTSRSTLVDTTPPVISSVVATPHADGTATITWTTDEPPTRAWTTARRRARSR